jgi:hypothetical protein
MEFDALTIDTQVVETNSFDFDGGLLAQLKQFKDGPTRVVISSVVASEILKHLREKTHSAKEAAESAHRKLILYGLKPKDDVILSAEVDTAAIAAERLKRYFEDISAEIVHPEEVNIRELLRMYFGTMPPFGNSPKKKSEFPDAIALVSLEKWATKNDLKLLAVSGDGDWQAYKGERVTPIADLTAALAKLQNGTDAAEALVRSSLAGIESLANSALANQLEELLRESVRRYIVSAEADSSVTLEEEGVSLTLNSFSLDPDGDQFALVQVGTHKIVVNAAMTLNVLAEAEFSMSVYDGVDKDMVPMGSMSASKDDQDLEVDVLITFEGNFEAGEIKISEAEIIGGPRDTINFGYVEPDFGYDPYEDEPDEGGEQSSQAPEEDGLPL